MKNVLNYFVRKAFGFKSTATADDKTLFGHLLRIRQNIQGVYDWLYGKVCGSADGTIPRYMPMTEAVTSADGHEVHIAKAWNSDTLLAHLRLLDGRKITNGYADGTPANDGLPDGVSLARLLCDSTLQPTALIDDNVGWVMDKNLPTNFPLVERLVLGCAYVLNFPSGQYLPTNLREIEFPELISWGITSEYRPLFIYNNPNITELTFPKCKAIGNGFTYADSPNTGCFISTCENLRVVRFPEMYKYGAPEAGFGATYEDNYGTLVYGCPNLEELYLPKWTGYRSWRIVQHCPALKKLVLGTISTGVPSLYSSTAYPFSHCTNLLHLEIQGASVSLDFRSWSPTLDSSNLSLFLDNFRQYLMLRLADRSSISSALKLTLSAGVYNAVTGAEDGLASTLTLGELGVELTEKEIAAGITLDTTYASWLDTYRAAIKWDIASV